MSQARSCVVPHIVSHLLKPVDNSTDVIAFAAGNDGEEMSLYSQMSQIGSTSAAKNSICVGATESCRPSIGLRYNPRGLIGHPDNIAYNS